MHVFASFSLICACSGRGLEVDLANFCHESWKRNRPSRVQIAAYMYTGKKRCCAVNLNWF